MPKPSYFEIDRDKLDEAQLQKLVDVKGIRLRSSADGTRWIARAEGAMPDLPGGRKATAKEWDGSGKRPSEPRRVKKWQPWGLVDGRNAWRVAGSSQRTGTVKWTRRGPRRVALAVTLGDGGEQLHLETTTGVPEQAKGIAGRVVVSGDTKLSVAIELRSARGTVVSALPAQKLEKLQAKPIHWSLKGVDATARGKVATLVLVLSTEADAASLRIDEIAFTH